MSKGGKTETKTTVPAYYEDAHKAAIEQANQLGQIGYMPFMGLDVAAQTPAHQASYQGLDQIANAFGMPAGASTGGYLPQQQSQGGVTGYSSFQPFDFARAQLAAAHPAQYAAFNAQWMDPVAAPQAAPPGAAPGAGQRYASEYETAVRNGYQGTYDQFQSAFEAQQNRVPRAGSER